MPITATPPATAIPTIDPVLRPLLPPVSPLEVEEADAEDAELEPDADTITVYVVPLAVL